MLQETRVRIQELRKVLQDLREQEHTYVELLDEYSDVQSKNRELRDRLTDSMRASEARNGSARPSTAAMNNREKKLAELQRANSKQRGGLLQDLSESDRASTPTETETSFSDFELPSASRRNGPQVQAPQERQKMAALRSYEHSLMQLRKDIQQRLVAASGGQVDQTGKSGASIQHVD